VTNKSNCAVVTSASSPNSAGRPGWYVCCMSCNRCMVRHNANGRFPFWSGRRKTYILRQGLRTGMGVENTPVFKFLPLIADLSLPNGNKILCLYTTPTRNTSQNTQTPVQEHSKPPSRPTRYKHTNVPDPQLTNCKYAPTPPICNKHPTNSVHRWFTLEK
jgi:hypothetical protein